jgi:hypothetical protein
VDAAIRRHRRLPEVRLAPTPSCPQHGPCQPHAARLALPRCHSATRPDVTLSHTHKIAVTHAQECQRTRTRAARGCGGLTKRLAAAMAAHVAAESFRASSTAWEQG